jgi:hypothetical protein
LHVLLQRLLSQTDALHATILLLRLRRLLRQANALHQAILVHRVRRLLLQADAYHVALLCAARIDLRTARLLPTGMRDANKCLPY